MSEHRTLKLVHPGHHTNRDGEPARHARLKPTDWWYFTGFELAVRRVERGDVLVRVAPVPAEVAVYPDVVGLGPALRANYFVAEPLRSSKEASASLTSPARTAIRRLRDGRSRIAPELDPA